MDAQNNANFINSVATGAGIACPNCNTMNEPDSSFCFVCGNALAAAPQAAAFEPVATPEPASAFEPAATPEPAPAFEPAATSGTTNAFEPVTVTETVNESENKGTAPAFAPVNEVKEEPKVEAPKVEQPQIAYVEPESVFAQGLPEWSVEPPQVVVRRHKKV